MQTTSACDTLTIGLTCATSQMINIKRAEYGRQDGVHSAADVPTCFGSGSSSDCESDTAQEQVILTCEGKESCSVLVSTATFGDPCIGVSKLVIEPSSNVQFHIYVSVVAI